MRPLRWGMIGGGEGAFIGGVHRMAARLDGRYQLLAGVFSSDAEKTRRSALALGVDPARAYPSVEAMIAGEKDRLDGVEVISIVTPNHVHYAQSAACLEAGLDVICDKPLTTNLPDADKISDWLEHGDGPGQVAAMIDMELHQSSSGWLNSPTQPFTPVDEPTRDLFG